MKHAIKSGSASWPVNSLWPTKAILQLSTFAKHFLKVLFSGRAEGGWTEGGCFMRVGFGGDWKKIEFWKDTAWMGKKI